MMKPISQMSAFGLQLTCSFTTQSGHLHDVKTKAQGFSYWNQDKAP